MPKETNIFIKIDEFIFHKLDYLKDEGVFQKFDDIIANLNENQQKIAAQVTTFTFLLFPFVFAALLFWGNWQTKKALETKKQILEQIAFLDGNKNVLSDISANYPNAINSEEDLNNKLAQLMSINSIDQQKISISQFQQTSTSTIAKMEANINFRDFGIVDFSNFMRTLMETEHFKILKMELKKNKSTNLLEGVIFLNHLGKNSNSLQE